MAKTRRIQPLSKHERQRLPLRAVIYTRVSSDQQGGKSVAEQEKELRRLVELNGWNLYEVFSDNDKGASQWSRDVRADWMRLNEQLAAGRFDVLVVWEMSRATRDRVVWSGLAAECEANNILICTSNGLFDPNDPDDAYFLDQMISMAAREAAYTRKRVARGTGDRAKAGKPAPGIAPFGYTRVLSLTTARPETQVPDEKSRTSTAVDGATVQWSPADIVRKIFKDAEAGKGAYTIALELDNLGIPNPRTLHAIERFPDKPRKYASTWSRQPVINILRNPAYLGHRQSHDEVVKLNAWPALVSEETFYALANRFASRALPEPYRASTKHELTSITICDVCSRGVQFTNQNQLDAYRCPVGHTYVLKADAEAFVAWCFASWLAIPAHLEAIRSAHHDEAEIAAARADVERLEADLQKWKSAAMRDDIPFEEYLERKAYVAPQLEDAKRRAKVLGLPSALHALAELDDPAADWQHLGFETRRQVMSFLAEIRLCRVGRGKKNVPIHRRVEVRMRTNFGPSTNGQIADPVVDGEHDR